LGPELESDPERDQLLAGRSARTGSGQSVDGTSSRRQGAPFAGSLLRSRLFVPSTRTSSSNADPRGSTFARQPLFGERSPAGADGARKRGAAGWSDRARRSSCFRTESPAIQQREVLLAHVLSPLRARRADRKRSRDGGSVGKDSPTVAAVKAASATGVSSAARLFRARIRPSQSSSRSGSRRGFDEVVEGCDSVLAGWPR
jgi:hypothetical protein